MSAHTCESPKLQRSTSSTTIPAFPPQPRACGPYRLDSRGKTLFRGGEPVGLSQYEFEVLHLLVRRPTVVLSKDVLIRAGGTTPRWATTASRSS